MERGIHKKGALVKNTKGHLLEEKRSIIGHGKGTLIAGKKGKGAHNNLSKQGHFFIVKRALFGVLEKVGHCASTLPLAPQSL